MSVWTIVVAAGSGTRFGRAKQFETLRGRRVLDWSIAPPRRASATVWWWWLPPSGVGGDAAVDLPAGVLVAEGGPSRSASVRNGLAPCPPMRTWSWCTTPPVPWPPIALFPAVIDAVRAGADGALPAVAVTDTVRHVAGGTVDRAELLAVQTPQAFAAVALRRVHATDVEATDDAGLVEAAGGRVVIVTGEAANQKLTNPDDLAVAAALAPDPDVGQTPQRHRRRSHGPAGGTGLRRAPLQSTTPARPLVLGGVVFDEPAACAATATPTSSPTPAPTPCSAPPASATSACCSPTPTPRAPAPTASCCSPRWPAACVPPAGSRPTSTAPWSPTAPKLRPPPPQIERQADGRGRRPGHRQGPRAEGLGALGRREGVACWAVALLIRPPALRRPVTTSSPS